MHLSTYMLHIVPYIMLHVVLHTVHAYAVKKEIYKHLLSLLPQGESGYSALLLYAGFPASEVTLSQSLLIVNRIFLIFLTQNIFDFFDFDIFGF